MKKKFKKVVAVILTMAMTMSVGLPAFADDEKNNILDTMAKNIIIIEQVVDENGNFVTTYNNLDTFVSSVKERYKEVSDLEIATYIMMYTGQKYEGLPEAELLRILTYKYICTTVQTVNLVMNDEVIAARDSVTDTIDETMEITTSYALTKTENGEKYYDVWANADWIDYPLLRYADAFTIGHNVIYDDSVAPHGYLFQTFKCDYCNKTSSNNAYVTLNDEKDGSLELKYGVSPSLHINAKQAICKYCVLKVKDTKFSTIFRFGVIAPNGTGNIQASYAHGTISLGDIDVSFSGHKPVFSASIVGAVDVFEANTRTLR